MSNFRLAGLGVLSDLASWREIKGVGIGDVAPRWGAGVGWITEVSPGKTRGWDV